MGKILKICVVLIVAVATMWSCSSSGCIDNQSSIPLAGFYDSKTKKKLKISGINIGGVGVETLLLSSSESAAQVYLPLRSTQSSTAFYFNYGTDSITGYQYNDTITFDYESIPYFVSEECGAMYYYKVGKLQSTHLLIDSVKLLEPLITNTDVERVKIYFRSNDTQQ